MLIAEELTTIDLRWGVSSPKVLRCDDNQLHVVKFTDDRWGPRGCANELVVGALGAEVGLSVPPCGVVWLPSSLIEDEPAFRLPNGRGVTPGKHFRCLYYEDNFPITATSLMEKAGNLDQLPSIIGLDHWVYNRDRADRQDNLLLANTSSGLQIVPIDHGLAFNSDLWTIGTLEIYQDNEDVFNLTGECYSILMQHIRRNQLRAFESFIERMFAVNRDSLERIVSQVPTEWGVTQAEREGLVNFLLARQEVVARVLRRLTWN